MDLQSYLLGFPTLFHITQFGAMMQWGQWRGSSLLVLDCLNTWNYGNNALNKAQLMWWRWVYMWIIGRMFCCICQNLCLLKGSLFGGLLAFQQLEVELCESWVVVHKADFLFKRLGHLSLLWAQELKANSHIHPV